MKTAIRLLAPCLLILMIGALYFACGSKEEAPAGPASKAEPGRLTVVSTYPSDGGMLLRLDHPLYIRFSGPVERDNLSFEVSPDAGPWEVRWTDANMRVELRHEQPFAAGRPHTLTFAVQPGLKKTRIEFSPFGPDSLELVDQAEQEGRIDVETAWTYRLQRVFEPGQLPEAYRSPTPIPDFDWLVRDYVRIRPTLDPETARALDRYLKPPTDPESFFYEQYHPRSVHSAAPSWLASRLWAAEPAQPDPDGVFTVDCATAPIKVWAPMSLKGKAEEARAAIDKYSMYGQFHGLLGREPRGYSSPTFTGGDDSLNIYVVSKESMPWFDKRVRPAMGVCIPIHLAGRKSSAYILIDEALSGKDLAATLAHELFHAFQFNFDVYEDRWWMEATAVWAEDHIDETWNTEQEYLDFVFDLSANSMKPLNEVGDLHEYGIYLFPFYLSRKHGDGAITEIWKKCEAVDSLEAVEQAVGLGDALKEFSLFNLDAGEYRAKYPDHGGPLRLFPLHDDRDIDLSSTDRELLDKGKREKIKVPHLGAAYVKIYNWLDEAVTPLVRFNLKPFSINEDLAIQAVFDPGGDERTEDWTGLDERELCIERDDEKFMGIALVISNKNKTELFEPEFIIEVDADGCQEKRGSALVTYILKDETNTDWRHDWPSGAWDRRQIRDETDIEATARLEFELKDARIETRPNWVVKTYAVTKYSLQGFRSAGRYEANETGLGIASAYSQCRYSRTTRKEPARVEPVLECRGDLAVAFDLDTGKAKWVSFPLLTVRINQTNLETYRSEGCGNDDSRERDIPLPPMAFPLGPVNLAPVEGLAADKTELEQMAREMEALAKKGPGMSREQMQQFVEQFKKRHDIDKLTQSMAGKVVSPDLVPSGGDGKFSIQGGGSKYETEPVDNGTRQSNKEFKWRISIK